jgi:hypothetical protein
LCNSQKHLQMEEGLLLPHCTMTVMAEALVSYLDAEVIHETHLVDNRGVSWTSPAPCRFRGSVSASRLLI